MQEIFNRRSIRRYENKTVTDEQIEQLLRAAMYAPSAGNEQPWHFVVIKDRETLNRIMKIHPYTQMLREASLAIIPCADTSKVKYNGVFWPQDMAASIQNILLQANGIGLGTCWCGVYPREELMNPISEIIDLPKGVNPFAVVAVGYPAEKGMAGDRFKREKVHYEKW